jgi:hypothetical protein
VNVRIREGLKVYRRSRDFLSGNVVTPEMTPVIKLAERLNQVIVRLSALAVQQDAAVRSTTAKTRTARELARTLRRGFLRPVAQLGKTLFPNDPSIRQSLRMPKSDDYIGLMSAAKSMAQHAATHKEAFAEEGFGDEFVNRVLTTAESLERVLKERDDAVADRQAAGAGLEEQMKRGGEALRLLDTLLSHDWAKVPERLTKWKALSRFDRPQEQEGVASGRAPVSTPAAPSTPAPVVTGPAPVPATPVGPVSVGTISPPVTPAVASEVTATKSA